MHERLRQRAALVADTKLCDLHERLLSLAAELRSLGLSDKVGVYDDAAELAYSVAARLGDRKCSAGDIQCLMLSLAETVKSIGQAVSSLTNDRKI